MKAYTRRIAAAGLCLCMAVGMTGCAGKAPDGSQKVATVGEKEMTLGEANFLLRFQQAETEESYESMMGGMNIYSLALSEDTTYGDTMKSQIMSMMHEYYILEEKAADYGVELTEEDKTAITEAAKAFLDANETYTKEQMTADQSTVERVLTLQTIGTKAEAAIKANADVTVTEEEAVQRGFTYVQFSRTSDTETDEDGAAAKLSDAEIQAGREKLQEIASAVAAGETIDAAAEASGFEVKTGTYGKDNTYYYDTALIDALDGLAEGEVSGVIDSETGMFVAVLTTENDEEATASRMSSLMTSKANEYYAGLMEEWKEEYPLTVVEDVWEDVVFDRSYALKASETEE